MRNGSKERNDNFVRDELQISESAESIMSIKRQFTNQRRLRDGVSRERGEESGIVLVTALLILLAITSLAFTGWLISTMDIRISSNLKGESQSEFVLHTGLAHALAHLNLYQGTNKNINAPLVRSILAYSARSEDWYYGAAPFGAVANQKYRYRIIMRGTTPCGVGAAGKQCTLYSIQVEALHPDSSQANPRPVASLEVLKEDKYEAPN